MRPSPAAFRCWVPAVIGLLWCLDAAGAIGSPPSSQPLTNEDIVRLVSHGTDEQVILAEIATRQVDFDLEEEIVVELRLVGVNERLIEAMRRRQYEISGGSEETDPAAETSDVAPAGFLVVDLGEGGRSDPATPFAITALPHGVEASPGMEVGLVDDLAVAVLCRTSDHVPDHWDIRSPIVGAPRHGVLFFQPASRPDKVKKFEVLRLATTATPPIGLAAGNHSLIVALAGRSAGSGTWQLLASDPVTVEIATGATVRIRLTASSSLRGNRMTGYSVEHEWKVAERPRENPE